MHEDAGVAGVTLKGRAQLDAEERHFRGNALGGDDIPQLAYFRVVQGAGIEAVFTSVLIALLTAAVPSWDAVRRRSGLGLAALLKRGRGKREMVCVHLVCRISPA